MHERTRRVVGAGLAMAAAIGLACGADQPTQPSPVPAPGDPVVTITAAGVAPRTVTVTQGARVLFVNDDTVDHDMSSDDHPTHEQWPAINQVGYLRPGESRETGNLTEVGVLTYHDHLDAQNQSLNGSIVVTPFGE